MEGKGRREGGRERERGKGERLEGLKEV